MLSDVNALYRVQCLWRDSVTLINTLLLTYLLLVYFSLKQFAAVTTSRRVHDTVYCTPLTDDDNDAILLNAATAAAPRGAVSLLHRRV